MPKERGQEHHQLTNTNESPSKSIKEKAFHQIHQQHRPQKKFSLASAFPIASTTIKGHSHSKHSPRIAQVPHSNALLALNQTKSEEQKPEKHPQHLQLIIDDKKFGARKLSAPVDYRDSGVYLGEISSDPVLEMWKEDPEKTDTVGECDSPVLASSAPTSLKTQMKRRFRKNNAAISTQPQLTASESCKSLPSIDSLVVTDCSGGGMPRSNTCDQNSVILHIPSIEHPDNDQSEQPEATYDDYDETWNESDRLLGPENTSLRRSLRMKGGRNAQSFSTENLLEVAEEMIESACESPQHDHGQDKNIPLDDIPQKSRINRTRSSLYRRSRSLAEGQMIRVSDSDEEHEEHEETEFVKRDDEETGVHSTGGISRFKRLEQKAMGVIRSETSEEAVCERKKMAAKKKRSIADPIAKKLTLTFLRRRQTGTSLTPPIAVTTGTTNTNAGTNAPAMNQNSNPANSSSSSSYQGPPKAPSREEVRKWATSFEHLLNNKYGVMLFRLFLQREFSEENIDFWIACEEYKKLKDGKLALQARQIYNDFVAVQAPKEVNLDSVTRSMTMAALSNPNKRTFEQAQHRIQSLMEKDSYPRFLRSDLYLDLVRKS